MPGRDVRVEVAAGQFLAVAVVYTARPVSAGHGGVEDDDAQLRPSGEVA
jgi:hypothetical protein